MITFPNAKINLGLKVLSKRPDGYHEICTGLYPVNDLCDILEINEAREFSFTSSGLDIDGESESNLVVKAYRLLKQHRSIPPVTMHLHKVIPMGAGLGGGSSDGAFALKMLNELLRLELSEIQLLALAGELGSDCPFFIKNTPALASGTGTTLEPIELDLSAYEVRLVHPGVQVPTQEAYSVVVPSPPHYDLNLLLKSSPEDWNGKLINDFEQPVMSAYPAIAEAKSRLISDGAVYTSMTGSGSSVFGLFEVEGEN